MAQRDGIRLTSHFARGTFPDVACLQRSARGKERSRPLVRSEGKRVGKKSRLDRSVKWTSPLEGLGRTATSLAGCSHRAAPPLRAAAAAPPPGVRENEPSQHENLLLLLLRLCSSDVFTREERSSTCDFRHTYHIKGRRWFSL